MEYADEPRLIFSPLTDKDYCDFYNLEMDSFADDAEFYLSYIDSHHTVLELGCGSGRLTRLLAGRCQHVTGVDISEEMLKYAGYHSCDNITYIHADILTLALKRTFDIIIIPYNTLNMLGSESGVKQCLHICQQHLQESGKLLFEVYHPDKKILEAGDSRIFQFSVLKRANGDTLIKETLKSYNKDEACLSLIERYRDRPLVSQKENRDLQHELLLYAPRRADWEALLYDCSFKFSEYFGDYTSKLFCYEKGTRLLVSASLH